MNGIGAKMSDVANSTNQIQFCLFASGGKISAPATRSLFTFPMNSTLNFPTLTGTHDVTCKANLPWAVHLVRIRQIQSFVSIVTDLPWQTDKHDSYFYHCVYIPSLKLIAFIMLELFTIMSWICRYYTPEPRFQTANQETWIRSIIPFNTQHREMCYSSEHIIRKDKRCAIPARCVINTSGTLQQYGWGNTVQ